MQETQKTWSLIPGSGRYPEGGNDNPFQYSCLEKFHGQRSLVGYRPWGCSLIGLNKHHKIPNIFLPNPNSSHFTSISESLSLSLCLSLSLTHPHTHNRLGGSKSPALISLGRYRKLLSSLPFYFKWKSSVYTVMKIATFKGKIEP